MNNKVRWDGEESNSLKKLLQQIDPLLATVKYFISFQKMILFPKTHFTVSFSEDIDQSKY